MNILNRIICSIVLLICLLVFSASAYAQKNIRTGAQARASYYADAVALMEEGMYHQAAAQFLRAIPHEDAAAQYYHALDMIYEDDRTRSMEISAYIRAQDLSALPSFETKKAELIDVYKDELIVFIEEPYSLGVLKSDGTWKLPPEFMSVAFGHDGYYISAGETFNSAQCGMLRSDGSVLIPPVYDDVTQIGVGFYAVSLNHGRSAVTAVCNQEGQPIIPFRGQIDYLPNADTKLYERNGRLYLFPSGQAPAADDGLAPSDSTLLYLREGDLIQAVNQQGQTVSVYPLQAQRRASGCPGLYYAEKNGMWSVVNADDSVTLPVAFSAQPVWQNGVFIGVHDGKHGCITKDGRIVLDFEWAGIQPIGSTMLSVLLSGQPSTYMLTDLEGHPISNARFSSVSSLNEDMAIVQPQSASAASYTAVFEQDEDIAFGSDNTPTPILKRIKYYGVINVYGETVLNYEWELITPTECGLIQIKKDGLFGFANAAGEVVVPCQYPKTKTEYAYHVLCYRKDYRAFNGSPNTLCFLNLFGERIASGYTHSGIQSGSQGLTKFGRFHPTTRTIFVNHRGEPVISGSAWRTASDFSGGLAVVKGGKSRCGMIDMQGNLVIPCEYYSICHDENTIYLCKEHEDDPDKCIIQILDLPS